MIFHEISWKIRKRDRLGLRDECLKMAKLLHRTNLFSFKRFQVAGVEESSLGETGKHFLSGVSRQEIEMKNVTYVEQGTQTNGKNDS